VQFVHALARARRRAPRRGGRQPEPRAFARRPPRRPRRAGLKFGREARPAACPHAPVLWHTGKLPTRCVGAESCGPTERRGTAVWLYCEARQRCPKRKGRRRGRKQPRLRQLPRRSLSQSPPLQVGTLIKRQLTRQLRSSMAGMLHRRRRRRRNCKLLALHPGVSSPGCPSSSELTLRRAVCPDSPGARGQASQGEAGP